MKLPESAVGVSAAERLVTTLVFAALLHGIVIFGVTFTLPLAPPSDASTVEVTVVPEGEALPPDVADYLAQADRRGAGNTRTPVRPQAPASAQSSFSNDGLEIGADWITLTEAGRNRRQPDTLRAPDAPPEAERQLLTQSEAARRVTVHALAPPGYDAPRLMIARLLTESSDDTSGVGDINQQALAYSKRVREKFVAVNTRESPYAFYLERWRRRVERIGNLNYPDELRRQGLTGSLELEVALNADGTIRDLVTRRPAPHRLLDQAAVRILRLAAPFTPFPEHIRRETDVLRFVYEWRFSEGRVGSGRLALPKAAPEPGTPSH
ncbi:MAG TPA: energy transducer TonB [Gammaproteobacteria bacterium]|nr:energy transducer TonB [Gammaproteobacteria bacterium]